MSLICIKIIYSNAIRITYPAGYSDSRAAAVSSAAAGMNKAVSFYRQFLIFLFCLPANTSDWFGQPFLMGMNSPHLAMKVDQVSFFNCDF